MPSTVGASLYNVFVQLAIEIISGTDEPFKNRFVSGMLLKSKLPQFLLVNFWTEYKRFCEASNRRIYGSYVQILV